MQVLVITNNDAYVCVCVFFRTVLKKCSWESNIKHVVKYDVDLDRLLMGPIYVIKYTFVRGTPMSGKTHL